MSEYYPLHTFSTQKYASLIAPSTPPRRAPHAAMAMPARFAAAGKAPAQAESLPVSRRVQLGSKILGEGWGGSRRQAEQDAARSALEALGFRPARAAGSAS